jgi:glycosyltransferase involved in cell wall biosynthesis
MATFFFMQQQNIELIVKGGKPMGGAVVATHVWMQALHELGHQVYLFQKEEDNREILPEFQWIKTKKVYNSKKGIPVFRWFYYRFPRISNTIRSIKPDLVFESIPSWGSPFVSLICRAEKTKYLVRLANDNMLDERFKLTHSLFERTMISLSFRFCNYILAQNSYQFDILKKRYPKQNVLQVLNPIKLKQQYLIQKKYPKGCIAWVANFRYQKNFKLLYQIASIIKEENFLIAGQPMNPMDAETSEFLRKLEELPNVKFVGNVPRSGILEFFKEAKFLLNTSRYEGFSNTFLEAMCTGTPILSTENVNPDGIISGYELGYIFSDQNDLKNFLSELNDSIYSKYSLNCIDFVQVKHNHLELGRHLLDFLEISD